MLRLEPLLRCNLAFAGSGKMQYPQHILERALTVEQCIGAAKECGAPPSSASRGENPAYTFNEPRVGYRVAMGRDNLGQR